MYVLPVKATACTTGGDADHDGWEVKVPSSTCGTCPALIDSDDADPIILLSSAPLTFAAPVSATAPDTLPPEIACPVRT